MAPAVLALLLGVAGCTTILGLSYDYEPRGTGGSHITLSTTTTTSSSGGGSGGSGGAAPACGSYVWDASQPKCDGCMAKSCCAELKACDTGSACAEIAACGAACMDTDTACKKACIDSDSAKHSGAGLASWVALFNCYDDNCTSGADACSYPICDGTYTDTRPTCATCLSQQPACCMAFTACNTDTVCNACLADASSMGCSANMAFAQVNTCDNTTCGVECAFLLCGNPASYPQSSCNFCLSQAGTAGCCTEIDACTADQTSVCYQCFIGNTTGTACTSDAKYSAFSTCYNAKCTTQCAGL
jgi:hypothetical protein